MSTIVHYEIKVNEKDISAKLEDLLDSQTMLEVHNLFAKMMEPYVPFGSDLANMEVTPDYVKYDTPYAHYHYEGKVYGPNIPIIQDGIVVGWFSIPGKKKEPTGADLKFKKPKASAHWDEAMLAERKEEFVTQIKEILKRRARELYG